MALPPGFLDDLRSRVSLSAIVGRRVIWDERRSKRGRGDMWAPCPFHQEKTASFHVDDAKGFYYCFGCHAKGDAITFLREAERLSFMEAVEVLAREAGMEMPAPDPGEAAQGDRRARLGEALEDAIRFYRRRLSDTAGGEARRYLEGRGLDADACARWEIGLAPEAGGALLRHLAGAGFTADEAVDAGLAARPEGGGAPYERFRGRIILPIRDARGDAIGLGGRALSAAARAKYINSPETELFDKGRALYNLAGARAALKAGRPLIVAEGYMDVIALAEAGFAAVAPLGTAITEAQLRLLWRLSPEPVIALDGDEAGQRAAARVIDIALPHLTPDRGLRFALLPEGQDPDDLLRAGGAAAMRSVLDAAEPLVGVLFRREAGTTPPEGPEARARIEARLATATGRIADPRLRRHYEREMRGLLWRFFAPPQRRPRGRPGQAPAARRADPLAETRRSVLASAPGGEEGLQEAVILATLIRHPALLEEFSDPLAALEMSVPEHRPLQAALLDLAADPPADTAAALRDRAGAQSLEKLFAPGHVRLAPGVAAEDDAKARFCLAEGILRLESLRAARRETEDAMSDITGPADERLTLRLREAARRRDRSLRALAEGAGDFEIAENGVRIDPAERGAFEALLAGIGLGPAARKGED